MFWQGMDVPVGAAGHSGNSMTDSGKGGTSPNTRTGSVENYTGMPGMGVAMGAVGGGYRMRAAPEWCSPLRVLPTSSALGVPLPPHWPATGAAVGAGCLNEQPFCADCCAQMEMQMQMQMELERDGGVAGGSIRHMCAQKGAAAGGADGTGQSGESSTESLPPRGRDSSSSNASHSHSQHSQSQSQSSSSRGPLPLPMPFPCPHPPTQPISSQFCVA